MEELTGVHIEFEVISNADAETRVQLILAGEDCPDAMVGAMLTQGQITSCGAAGLLVNLREYMTEEYMPNFVTGMAEMYPDLMGAVTLEDGNIYVLPSGECSRYDTWAGVYVYSDRLDQLGIAMPASLDEFTNMLVAFKDNNMNGNGDATDEIPLAFQLGNNGCGIASWFGVGWNMICVDDQAIFSPATEGRHEYVRYMHKLWDLGVMDVEAFTQDGTTFTAKGTQADTLYGVVLHGAQDWFTTADKAPRYQIMLPVETGAERSGGVIKQRTTGKVYNLRQGVVFNNGQDLPTLLGWFDNFYDPCYGEIATKGFLNGILAETEGHKLAFCAPEAVPEQYANQTD